VNARRPTPNAGRDRARGAAVRGMRAALFATLLLTPATGHAGLDLAWNQCAGSGGVSDVTLACGAAGTPVSLYCTVSSYVGIPDLVAMEINFDIWSDSGTLPTFWQLDSPISPGACNAGYVFSDALGSGQCPGTANPWGSSPPGSEAEAILGFSPFAGGQLNRGRFVAMMFRPVGNPTAIAGGAQTFAFRLDFYSDPAVESGGACAGCSTPAVFVLRDAVLYGSTGSAYVITDPGILSNCATVGSGGSVGCFTRAVQNRTWGALKAIYR